MKKDNKTLEQKIRSVLLKENTEVNEASLKSLRSLLKGVRTQKPAAPKIKSVGGTPSSLSSPATEPSTLQKAADVVTAAPAATGKALGATGALGAYAASKLFGKDDSAQAATPKGENPLPKDTPSSDTKPSKPFTPSQSNKEFHDKMTQAGINAGMSETQAKQMASLSAHESGWGKQGIAGRGTNNYFGQTIRPGQVGTKGIVGGTTGADRQLHAVYDSPEAAVSHHLEKWGKHYTDDPATTYSNLVKAGYNTVDTGWQNKINRIHGSMAASTPSQPEQPKQQVAQADTTTPEKESGPKKKTKMEESVGILGSDKPKFDQPAFKKTFTIKPRNGHGDKKSKNVASARQIAKAGRAQPIKMEEMSTLGSPAGQAAIAFTPAESGPKKKMQKESGKVPNIFKESGEVPNQGNAEPTSKSYGSFESGSKKKKLKEDAHDKQNVPRPSEKDRKKIEYVDRGNDPKTTKSKLARQAAYKTNIIDEQKANRNRIMREAVADAVADRTKSLKKKTIAIPIKNLNGQKDVTIVDFNPDLNKPNVGDRVNEEDTGAVFGGRKFIRAGQKGTSGTLGYSGEQMAGSEGEEKQQQRAQRVGAVGQVVSALHPVTGPVTSAIDTYSNLRQGEYGRAAQSAVGAIPVLGGIPKAIRTAGHLARGTDAAEAGHELAKLNQKYADSPLAQTIDKAREKFETKTSGPGMSFLPALPEWPKPPQKTSEYDETGRGKLDTSKTVQQLASKSEYDETGGGKLDTSKSASQMLDTKKSQDRFPGVSAPTGTPNPPQRAPVAAAKGEGALGVRLAGLGVSRENRRSNEFVTSTLGKEWAGKAGSAAANYALEKHFKNMQQPVSGTTPPAASQTTPSQTGTTVKDQSRFSSGNQSGTSGSVTAPPQNQSSSDVKPLGSGGSTGSMVNAGSGGITPAPTAPLETGDKIRGGAAALAQNKPAENKPDISTPGGGAVVPESGPSQKKKKVSESTLVQAYLQRFGKNK